MYQANSTCCCLQAKENNVQELSAGQVTTMARNEKVIEKLSGQPATYNLKRCLTVPWCNEKVI